MRTNDFLKCAFCKSVKTDICEMNMWQICDKDDKPTDEFIIVCSDKPCIERIKSDPILFIKVPWSRGGPGKFILLCGDCEHRDGFTCKHKDLKGNGGLGLEVKFTPTALSNVFVCFSNGKCILPEGDPATFCAGNPSV